MVSVGIGVHFLAPGCEEDLSAGHLSQSQEDGSELSWTQKQTLFHLPHLGQVQGSLSQPRHVEGIDPSP